jgi:U3 small nucleolar RNA-associated protein 25
MPSTTIKKAPRKGRSIRRGPKFAQSRLRDSAESLPDSIGLEEDEVEDHISSESESEIDEIKEVRPYNTLLQSLNVSLDQQDHPRKRQKTNHHKLETSIKAIEDPKPHDDDHLGEVVEDIEEPQDEIDENSYESDEDEEQTNIFQKHFENQDTEYLESRISSLQTSGWTYQKHSFGKTGKCTSYTPNNTTFEKLSPDLKVYVALNLKSRLQETSNRILDSYGETERLLLPYIFSYRDILFGARTVKNSENLRSLMAIHAVNHVFKTRDRILKHNSTLSSQDFDGSVSFRDQGFTRPKVLFVLPTRSACARVIDSIVSICKPEQQENRKRFDDEYVKSDSRVPEDRPEDYKELLDGNDDDMFRLGIKFTRKTVKFFSQFYSSDIILASPLGLRRAIESGGP